MIAQLLLQKILQLFLIMIVGFVLVKVKIVKSEDSTVLSKLSLYLFMPAVIINSFNMEITEEIMRGLFIAFAAAILIQGLFLLLDLLLKKYFGFTNVERASIMYSNAGNLIVPIITYVLGEEWLIYGSAYLIVQLVFLWTHGVKLFSTGKASLKKILLNINMLAVAFGFIMLLFRIRLPEFVSEITSSLGGMLAPAGMIIAGMLAASVDFRGVLKNKRLYLVTFARLVLYPVLTMVLLKGILFVTKIPEATVMLISYLASISPTASTIMQFAQLYGKDADYATAINAVTTILCILTMPVLVYVYLSF